MIMSGTTNALTATLRRHQCNRTSCNWRKSALR